MRICIQHPLLNLKRGYFFDSRKPLCLSYTSHSKYRFSTSAPVFTDPNDGTSLDEEGDIQSKRCRTKQEFDNYFNTKEKAIREEHRVISNATAMEQNDVDLNREILDERDNKLWLLKHQKDNIRMYLPYLRREDDTPSAEENEINKRFTPTISIHLAKSDSAEASGSVGNPDQTSEQSTSGQQNNFPQNSESITDDFPSSWEPFDD